MNELVEGPLWARLLGFFKALADPVRLSIVLSAMNHPQTSHELMTLTRKTKSQISKHVSLLKKLEFIQTSRHYKRIYLEVTPLTVTLLQTIRGVLHQDPKPQSAGENTPMLQGGTGEVRIPLQIIRELLADRARLLDLLLLIAQTTESDYWQAISELLQLAEQVGLKLDITLSPSILRTPIGRKAR